MCEVNVLNMRQVSFGYPQHQVFSDINFHVHGGEFLAIVGPNGGGKTTLLKLLLGLARPQQGEILVLGQPASKARGGIGYLPQQSHLDPAFPLIVLDLVMMGCLGSGFKRSQCPSVARRALALVGMEGLEKQKIFDLSGGQRQRVLIARALVANPQILLLDEPTASLDPKAEQDFFDLLAELNQKGITIMVVSHDLSFVSPYVQRVVCVNHNVVVHPVGDMVPEIISHLYGQPMRPILHHITDDHKCC